MSVQLADVSAIFGAAAQPSIEQRDVGWPEMTALLVSLRAVVRASERGVSGALERFSRQARTWQRLVSVCPLPLNDPQLGTRALSDELCELIDAGRDGHLTTELVTMRAALDAVLATDVHPASDVLAGALSGFERNQIACPSREQPLLRAWLAIEGFSDVGVASLEQLRNGPTCDQVVLLGPPERYLRSAWCDPTMARRHSGWLLTAPPAAHLCVVTWPGQIKFQAAGTTMFNTTRARPIVPQTFGATGGPAFSIDDIWRPDQVMPTVRIPRSHDNVEVVAAYTVVLADSSYVFYADEGWPQPMIVTWEQGEIEIAVVKRSRLRPGTVILSRPPRWTSVDELARRADALLAERDGLETVQHARAAKQELKDALAVARRARTEVELIRALQAKVGDHCYARHVIVDLSRPEYIAPEKRGALEALCDVLSVPDATAKRRLLTKLRTAHRRAGHEAREELATVLRDDQSWHEPLVDNGVATITVAGHGTLTLAAVIETADSAPVPRTALGQRRVSGGSQA